MTEISSQPVYINYLPVLALMGVAVTIAIVMVILSRIVGPRKPTERKLSVYESGMPLLTEAHGRFSVKFYIIAMLFILFDIEVVFLYPWAVVYKDYLGAGSFILIAGLVFIGIITLGFIYEWKRGSLDWE